MLINMSIVQEIAALADELPRLGSGITVHFERMPSGIAYLNVGVNRRSFVMAFLPQENGIGVDEILGGEVFDMGYRHWFTDVPTAKQKLLAMVNEAIEKRQRGHSTFL